MNYLDGKTIRDQMLARIQKDIRETCKDIHMAVIMIGDNAVCEKYVSLKKRLAERCGILVSTYFFNPNDKEDEITQTIEFLNEDPETDGIMIQIPVAEGFNQEKLISQIDPKKDIDGLRYCLGEQSDFVPPVVLAIMKSLESAFGGENEIADVLKDKKIILIGEGFLVGGPLKHYLNDLGIKPTVVLGEVKDPDEHKRSFAGAQDEIKKADIIISAVGKAGLIQPEMIGDDVVLVDAGTSESNGELKGDIDPECYKKASFYTPVPGGIGPLTVAFLLENLAESKGL